MTAIGQLDRQVFLYLNDLHSSFFDTVMQWVSHRFFWIPFYLLLFLLIIKWFGKRSLIVFASLILVIALSDQFSVLVKNLVQRPRPCHDPTISEQVHVNGDCGGHFGFVSSHAANTFALALFLTLLAGKRHRAIPYGIFGWAVFVSYSRIYNGVHYPLDLAGGALLGMFISFAIFTMAKPYIYKTEKG